MIEEAITSSQLEGAATTREAAKEMLREGRPPRDRSEKMILNNYQTMQMIANIKDKGLVIVTACGHAGIINTINYSKSLTGISKIYAIVGGFHLTGGIHEDIIESTVRELQNADPRYLIPCHCTGWKATNRIIEAMPGKFIQTSVGTVFHF